MECRDQVTWTAFEGDRLIATGDSADVAAQARAVFDRRTHGTVLIFDDDTGAQVEVDFRGTTEDVRRRVVAGRDAPKPETGPEAPSRGPGRPRLGVVAREVTLLPRHWEWLNSQPGGASVALRKLVEDARRRNEGKDRGRRAQEAAYRVMNAMAGNAPGFEEALRAFFAGDRDRFETHTNAWPPDVRDHARRLAARAFEALAAS